MPRLVRTLPKYRKHKASGQAVVTICGRDHYLGPHGTKASKAEYDRLIIEYLSSGRSPWFGAQEQTLSVVELAADYLRHAKTYYGTAKKSEYFRIVRVIRPVRELYGRLPAAEFGPQQFNAVRQRLVQSNLSRTYINEFMRRVVAIFRWGAAEGKIPAAVKETLAQIPGLRQGRCEARETAPVRPIADEVVDATLPFLPDVIADMVRLQRLTGARPAEICILRPCDVEQYRDEVWFFRPERHKTQHHGRERVIPIGPRAQAVLLRYLARDASAYCFRPVDSEQKRRAAQHAARTTLLSCGNKPGSNRVRKPKRSPGDRYETVSYRRAITRACDKAFPHRTLADIPKSHLTAEQRAELGKWQRAHQWSPNQLRHAAGMKRGEANDAAWKAMLSEFLPAGCMAPAVESKVLLSDAESQLLACRSSLRCDVAEDIAWVHDRLNDEHVPAEAFPSLGAYSLWTWARSYPDQFGESLWSKREVARVQKSRPINSPIFVLAVFDFEEKSSRRQAAMAADMRRATRDLAARAMWILGVPSPNPASEYADSIGDLLYRLSVKHARAELASKSTTNSFGAL